MSTSNNVDTELAEGLGLLFGWSRGRFYEMLARRSGIQIDVSSMMILGALTRSGPARTSELATSMGLDASTVSRHVARVIDRGWAVRSTDARDGRAALICLTRDGTRIRQKLWQEWVKLLHEAIEEWTADEREQFLALTLRLQETLTGAS